MRQLRASEKPETAAIDPVSPAPVTRSSSAALPPLTDPVESAMALKPLARDHFGRGSVLGFVTILVIIVLALLAVFWPVT